MKKKYLFSTVLLLFLISCDLKSASDYFNMASRLETQGDIKGAIKLLDQAIEKDPKYLPAYINRGVDKALLGDYRSAIADYNSVIKIAPANTLALFNRAKNEERLQNYLAAIDDLGRAINSKGGENLTIDLRQDSPIENGAEYDVPSGEIRFERAFIFYKIGNLRKAYQDLNACISQNYQMCPCLRMRGSIYLAYGKKEQGMNDLREAVMLGDTAALRMYNQTR